MIYVLFNFNFTLDFIVESQVGQMPHKICPDSCSVDLFITIFIYLITHVNVQDFIACVKTALTCVYCCFDPLKDFAVAGQETKGQKT